MYQDSDAYCYNNCSEGFEVVLTIDTSSSIEESDRENQIDAIKYIMITLWEIIGTKAQESKNLETYQLLKFGLVTFEARVTLHFGLDNNYTRLDDYLNKVDHVFENDVVYGDDTATAGALVLSVQEFENSPNIESLPNVTWTRVEVLFTGIY